MALAALMAMLAGGCAGMPPMEARNVIDDRPLAAEAMFRRAVRYQENGRFSNLRMLHGLHVG